MNIFKDKVVMITGAGSGIGRALAAELAGRGACVAISDVNAERIEKVRGELNEIGAEVTASVIDVADHEAVGDMVKSIADKYGRINYMFNNAGIGVGGEVRDITIREWRRGIEINLFGVINGIDAAYTLMVKQGGGHIVNISSIEGLVPFPGHVPYTVSKYAVVGLSHGLRMEGEPLGVKVSVVCPGYIDTEIFNDAECVNIDREKVVATLRDKLKSMPADECARRILRGVERNRATIVITGAAKILWLIQRFSPALMFRLMNWMTKIVGDVRIEDRQP